MQQGHESDSSSGSDDEDLLQYAHSEPFGGANYEPRKDYTREMKNVLGKHPMLFPDLIDEIWKHTSALFQKGQYVRIFPNFKKYKTNGGVMVDFMLTELKVAAVNSSLSGDGSPVHTYDLAFLTDKSFYRNKDDFLQIPCWDKRFQGENLETIIIQEVDQDDLYFWADSDIGAFEESQHELKRQATLKKWDAIFPHFPHF